MVSNTSSLILTSPQLVRITPENIGFSYQKENTSVMKSNITITNVSQKCLFYKVKFKYCFIILTK